MKVLAGQLRGRSFKQPSSTGVRPMSEKVRAALFDVTGPVQGLTVLDAYAGSGAAGFDAASRGAILVDAIEQNPKVAKTIEQNAHELGLDWGYILHRMSVETWLASPAQQPPAPRYDLIVADPPYQRIEADVLSKLADYLTKDGVMVVSHSSRIAAPMLESVELKMTKVYGDSSLSFYKS